MVTGGPNDFRIGIVAAGVRWNTPDIVYVAIGGFLALLTVIEVVLFSLAFTYAFGKVAFNGKRWQERIMSVFMLFLFWVLRLGALFLVASALPMPDFIIFHFPENSLVIAQLLGIALAIMLLILPAVISIFQSLKQTNQTKVQAEIENLRNTNKLPKVVIVMPVYNEVPAVLFTAISSAVNGDYPNENLHIFISFDDESESDIFLQTLAFLNIPDYGPDFIYPPLLEIFFRGAQVTISRFPHGGKRLTQKKTFDLINSIYETYEEKNSKLFVLFIDSDIVLEKSAISNFMWQMELKPNSKRHILGMTGVITVGTKGSNLNFLSLLQDMEYVHSQLFGRAIESAAGSVICMPGALTIFRYSSFIAISDEYFAEREATNLFDWGRTHLGEDRFLTHLLMLKAPTSHRIQFCHRAHCKTEAVFEIKNLLKQRRRWFVGFITNEAALLSDDRLWRKYPLLLVFRLVQDVISSTALFGYLIVVGIASNLTQWTFFWLALIGAYFIVNWLLMFTYGIKLHRFKAWLYPILFIFNPFVSWFYLVYAVLTINQRTWGGPRTDTKETHNPGLLEKDESYLDSISTRNSHSVIRFDHSNKSASSLADPSIKEGISDRWWASQEDLGILGVTTYKDRTSVTAVSMYNPPAETIMLSPTMPTTLPSTPTNISRAGSFDENHHHHHHSYEGGVPTIYPQGLNSTLSRSSLNPFSHANDQHSPPTSESRQPHSVNHIDHQLPITPLHNIRMDHRPALTAEPQKRHSSIPPNPPPHVQAGNVRPRP